MKRIVKVLLICAMVLAAAGCTPAVTPVLFGEWIIELDVRLGLDYETANTAHPEVSSEQSCYEAVQRLSEWGVLEDDILIEPDMAVDRETVAYVVANLVSSDSFNEDIKDIDGSMYPEHIRKAVGSGLMSLNGHKFDPDTIMDREELDELTGKLIQYVNDPPMTYNSSIRTVEPISFNSSLLRMTTDNNIVLRADDKVLVNGTVYEVREVNREENIQEVKLSTVNMNDAGYIAFSGSGEINLDEAKIIGEESSSWIEGMSSYVPNPSIVTVGYSGLAGTKKIGDYNLVYRLNKSNIKVQITKKIGSNGSYYADLTLYNIKPTYDWESDGMTITRAFFDLSYKTTESMGIKSTYDQNYYLNFSKLRPSDIISSLKQSFEPTRRGVKTSFDILTFEVPLPQNPAVTMVMKLQLNVDALGRMELLLKNEHEYGIEIRNNHMRTIDNTTHDADFLLNGNAETTLGFLTSLNLNRTNLLDIGVKSGMEAEMKTTVHIYDGDNMTSEEVELPVDYVNEALAANEDAKVCGDFSANWKLDVVLNSTASFAGRLGLTKTIHIFDKNNAPFGNSFKRHLENGQFVDKCTRGQRKTTNSVNILTTDKIQIGDYSILLKKNGMKAIRITGLPAGITKATLRYSSSVPSVASVDNNGNITGLSEGSTIITISDVSNRYQAYCNVLVSTS